MFYQIQHFTGKSTGAESPQKKPALCGPFGVAFLYYLQLTLPGLLVQVPVPG
jgi:hypothetical protein